MVHTLAEALDQQLVATESEIELPAAASLRPSGVLASRVAELDRTRSRSCRRPRCWGRR